MKNWYIKRFKKKVALKVQLLGADRRVSTHYVIPQGRHITITRNQQEHIFTFSPQHVYRQGAYNAVFAVESQAEVVELASFRAYFTSEDYAVAMNNKLAADFVKSNTKEKPNIVMLLVIASIGISIITLYYLFQLQSDLKQLVPPATTQFITNLFRR